MSRALLMFLAACGDNLAVSSISVSTGSLVPAFTPETHDYAITSLTSLAPIGVTVTAEAAGSIAINDVAATSGVETQLQLAPLEDLTIAADDDIYTVRYLSPDLPAMTVTTSARAGSEAILLTPNENMLLIVDRAGRPLYYRSDGAWYIDFTRQSTPDLGDVYTYMTSPAGDYAYALLGTNDVVRADFTPVMSTELVATPSHDAMEADSHEFVLLSADHYLANGAAQQKVDLSTLDAAWSASADVLANVVQEVTAGAATLEWWNTADPALYAQSVDGNDFTSSEVADYTHLNSIAVHPADDNLVLSLRHADEIIELDRATGAKRWTLGGLGDEFGLTADQKWSHQHFVRPQADGTLILFDNGNNLHQTRIVEVGLDEASKTLTSYKVVYTKPADQPQTTYMGSVVQASTGRYLIGWGGFTAQAGALAASEVIDGEVVWSLAFDDPSIVSYRALPGAIP